MQLNMNVCSDPTILSFQGLLLEEFLLEHNLRQEFNIPEKFSELASLFSERSATVLSILMASKVGVPIPPDVIKEIIDWVTAQRHTTLIARSIADIMATVRSPQDKYNSCCRSAICYALTGSYNFAFGALKIAASVNDLWARHHHIYGLIHGIQNRNEEAKSELEMAYNYEPYSETKARIGQALKLLNVVSAQ